VQTLLKESNPRDLFVFSVKVVAFIESPTENRLSLLMHFAQGDQIGNTSAIKNFDDWFTIENNFNYFATTHSARILS